MHNDIKPFFICICKLSLSGVGFDFTSSGLGQVVLITAVNPKGSFICYTPDLTPEKTYTRKVSCSVLSNSITMKWTLGMKKKPIVTNYGGLKALNLSASSSYFLR